MYSNYLINDISTWTEYSLEDFAGLLSNEMEKRKNQIPDSFEFAKATISLEPGDEYESYLRIRVFRFETKEEIEKKEEAEKKRQETIKKRKATIAKKKKDPEYLKYLELKKKFENGK